MALYHRYYQLSTKNLARLSGLKAETCLRPERSTEVTPKSQAEGSGLPLSGASLPAFEGGASAVSSAERFGAAERVNIKIIKVLIDKSYRTV